LLKINTSISWLEGWGSAQYAALGTMVLGHELYYHEPFCWTLLAQELPMGSVAKFIGLG